MTDDTPAPMQQAEDFRAESAALAALLEPLSTGDFDTKTQFKGWTIGDVIGHLYMFNHAALLTLEDSDAFTAFLSRIMGEVAKGRSFLQAQYPFLDGLAGRALFETWRDQADILADAYGRADPKQRLEWAGPSMSARSSITARQMETWAHGQELFDILGVARRESDRIRNIVHLGVGTFGWSFANRGLPVPETPPHLRLSAPSGMVWEWNAPGPGGQITGSAVDFARVVTQVRNIADTSLKVEGKVARDWMAIAQCFAGPPEDPPPPGTRFRTS